MVKLIRSGFHKDRTILAVFLLIILLSSFLLHTGLMTSSYNSLYNEYAEDTGLADFYVFAATMGSDISDVLDGKEYIESYRENDMVHISSYVLTTSKSSEPKDQYDLMICPDGSGCGCEKLEFTARDDSVEGKKIYLNLYTACSSGLCVGDKMYIDSDMGKYEYTVAGVFQHLFMGNSYCFCAAMVDAEEFARLQKDRDEYIGESGQPICDKLITVNIKDGFEIEKSLNDINSTFFTEKGLYSNGFTRETGIKAYTVIVNVMAGFMAAFALIMLVICIIMIVFTINNNISRDIINIGALRAVGFTVGQIRAALTAEYLLIGSAGLATGIGLSYGVYPVIDRLFIREISGLVWKNRFYPAQSFGVFGGILLVTLITVFISTMKIRSLHPATALRFGLASNSFKKNYLPLDTSRGELNMLLAAKSSLQSVGQGVIIFCIVTAVSFVTMFSLVLFYNTKVDMSRFQRMINGDVPDAYVELKDSTIDDAHGIIDRLYETDGVTQAYILDSVPAEIEDYKVVLIYVSDPECVDCGIYEGEMLREDNETVLGSSLASALGAGVGDEVEVKYNNKTARFLVTGLQQSAVNTRLYISEEAARSLGVRNDCEDIRVRINNASDERVDRVLSEVSSWGDSHIIGTINEFAYQHSNENTPVFAVGFIVLIMIMLGMATVILVIRLLMKTVFIKREKEFGIKKAVGFTSTQLRYQLSLSLMPTSLLAAAAGAAAGYFLVNPLFTVVLGGYGIRDADLIVKPFVSVVTAAVIAVMMFTFSFVMSGRMKKLSAYKLIQE